MDETEKGKFVKVASDVAEQEFERFCDEMDIDNDESAMDEDDLSGFNKHKRRILRAMANGALVINENGEAVYTPQRTNGAPQLVFHERTGASLMAMDGKKKGHDVTKMYAVLGDMCKCHQSVFAKLKGTDIKVCEALFALLMD